MAPAHRVGIVGAGQLAKMMGEVAHDVNVEVTVLASNDNDCAVASCDHFLLGSALTADDLARLAAQVDVVTFDHELVDLSALTALENAGVTLRPSSHSLQFSVDKAHQRTQFSALGLPVPRFRVVETADDLDEALTDFAGEVVVKAARGGYDGRGVVICATTDEARSTARQMLTSSPVVLEDKLELLGEVAQLVVRSLDGRLAFYPLVTTVQVSGMCVEVDYPSVFADFADQAAAIAERIATHIDLVATMAVEFFITPDGLLINELALRPHNSGHWTIEGATTSQFANHLRAVSGQELGPTSPRHPAVVMVNIVGADAPSQPEALTGYDDVYLHDYAKAWRPERKLGHLTATGDDVDEVRVRTWKAAHAYGTRAQEAT